MKNNSYSSLSIEIESEHLKESLTVIKDKKEQKDTVLFDSKKKAIVDMYKLSHGLAWWQLLYELEGKVIF